MSPRTLLSAERLATLWREGQFLHVRPAHTALAAALRTVRRVARPDAGGVWQVAAEVRPLYELAGADGAGLSCWAGLEPVARHALAAAGCAVRTLMGAAAPLPEPRVLRLTPPLTNVEALDHALLRCVGRHERALVRYEPAAVDPARLIVQLRLAWPDLALAVAVARDGEAHALRDRVARFLPDAVAVTGRDRPARVGPVVVATYGGLAHTPVALEHRRVVVALHAVEAVGEVPRYCLGHALRARLYGLLPRDARPAPHDRDLVSALFGFEEVSVPRHGCQARGVEVVRVRFGGGEPLPAGLDLPAVKRLGLWQHPLRNRLVARLADLLGRADRDALRARFPAVAAALPAVPGPRVLVLVETVGHGLEIARRLPGWPLVAEADVWPGGLSGAERDVLRRGREALAAPLPCAVLTSAALTPARLVEADAVVRADGGTGLAPLPGEDIPHGGTCCPRPLLLVDLDDRHHPELRRRARRRREAYAARGWFGPGVDPARARVERFLAGRPEEEP
jgi:hypothetical protein